jgi:hypothetical protein
MTTPRQFHRLLSQSRVVRPPRHRLATFGSSEIRYSLVTSLSARPPQSNLRTGLVKAERPKLITADTFAHRFRGFGEGAEEMEKWLKEQNPDLFRGLEYSFHNRLESTESHQLDARELARNIGRDLDSREISRATVIMGPERGWQAALMKFILDETTQSFPGNLRELEERGFFDPSQADLYGRRREIETLFARALGDADAIKVLAAKLKEYHLFNEYQDRFFSLVNR